MYFHLISSLKRRLILELQDSFSRHPVYDKIVPFIQSKFAFDERPQYGIVVKGTSANKVQVSPQNFLGTIESHVMLAYYNEPAYLLEWVREDLNVVREGGDSMPILAGARRRRRWRGRPGGRRGRGRPKEGRPPLARPSGCRSA